MTRLFCLLFCLQLSFTAHAQLPSSIPTSGLVAFYPFNGTLSNAASLSHQGNSLNITSTIDRFGAAGQAYFLNGTNASITLPSSVMQQVPGSFTVSIWVKPDTIGRGNVPCELIADKNASDWLNKFRIGFGAIAAGYAPDSTCFDAIVTSSSIPKISSPYPSNENWTHLVMVYRTDSNGTFKAYYNGQLYSSRINVGFVSGARQINVGRAIYPGAPAGGFFYKGSVDDIGIWNRALNDVEIADLYGCSFNPATLPSGFTTSLGDSLLISTGPATPGLSYQWQENQGNGFSNMVAGPNIAGVNGPQLLLRNLQATQSGHQYRCMMADTALSCLAATNFTTVFVSCPSIIANSPSAATHLVGDTVRFEVAAPTATNFLWQRSTGGAPFVNLSNNTTYVGTDSNVLIISNVSPGLDGSLFRCLVSDSASVCPDTSAAAVLTVNCPSIIINSPNAATQVIGDTVLFEVVAPGAANFQWQRSSGGASFVNLSNTTTYSGTNSPTLVISGVGINLDGAQFRCIVADSTGVCPDTSAAAFLNVSCISSITTQPVTNVNVLVGTPVNLTIGTTSLPSSFRWERRNTNNTITQISNGALYQGVNSTTLNINSPSLADDGSSFRCIVTSFDCIDTSDWSSLSVSCAPILSMQPRDTAVNVGQIAVFGVNLVPGVTYQWYELQGFSFVALQDGSNTAGTNAHQLYLFNVSASQNNALFLCITSLNDCSDTSSFARLTVGTNISVENLQANSFQLYPNPAQTSVRLTFEAGMPGGWLEVYDALGKRLQSIWLNRGEQHHVLQVDDWAAGLYLLRFGGQQQRLLIAR